MGTNGVEEVGAELDLVFQSARARQNATLERILRDNVGCQYLTKRHGLDAEKLHDDFKNAFKHSIPLCDYQDIHDCIERIADGDQSPVLCHYPILCFSLSSGTAAGKPKKFPVTEQYDEIYFESDRYMSDMVKRLREREFCERNVRLENAMVLLLAVSGKQFRSKGGYAVRSVLSNFYRSKHFQKRYSEKVYCSPIEVILSDDAHQGIYCHWLCGLLHSTDIWCIDATFAFNMDSAINLLIAHWQRLCLDIRHGELNPEITDPCLRQAMGRKLKADPELADRIEKECRRSSSWEGIVRKLWPNAVMVNCRTSGSTLKSYLPRINFYTGNLPIYSVSYGASEGGRLAIAISLQRNSAEEALYAFLPDAAFFEFILLQKTSDVEAESSVGGSSFVCSSEETTTVEIDGVNIGEYYQPVVTNFQGLYRYKLSDIIRIKGFQGESPIFEFICRKDAVLSVSSDKTDEAGIQMAMEKASTFLQKHGLSISDYTSSANVSCSPGYYAIFVELGTPQSGREDQVEEEQDMILQECCRILDGSFGHTYNKDRKFGRIGALQLCILKSGTFKVVLEQKLSKGSSISQYKPSKAMPWESELVTHVIRPRVVKSITSDLNEWNVFAGTHLT